MVENRPIPFIIFPFLFSTLSAASWYSLYILFAVSLFAGIAKGLHLFLFFL